MDGRVTEPWGRKNSSLVRSVSVVMIYTSSKETFFEFHNDEKMRVGCSGSLTEMSFVGRSTRGKSCPLFVGGIPNYVMAF